MLGYLYEKQMLSWRFSVEGFLGKAPGTTALMRKIGKQNHDVIGTEATGKLPKLWIWTIPQNGPQSRQVGGALYPYIDLLLHEGCC